MNGNRVGGISLDSDSDSDSPRWKNPDPEGSRGNMAVAKRTTRVLPQCLLLLLRRRRRSSELLRPSFDETFFPPVSRQHYPPPRFPTCRRFPDRIPPVRPPIVLQVFLASARLRAVSSEECSSSTVHPFAGQAVPATRKGKQDRASTKQPEQATVTHDKTTQTRTGTDDGPSATYCLRTAKKINK